MTYRNNEPRLDEIDRRILHALMRDARNTSAATIADGVNVSGATVRNRIHKLEDAGIIRGYNTQVDFELAEGHLTNLYLCDAPIDQREPLAHEAQAIPGVINVRSLMTGRRNLHVLAVGEDTSDLRRIARSLTDLGIEIEDEDLVEEELFAPYGPFNPDDGTQLPEPSDYINLSGDASVVKVTVTPQAPIAGLSLQDASDKGVIDDETLVIAIERDDQELTPRGDTVIRSDDVVTILSRGGKGTDALDVFNSPHQETESS